MTNFDQKYCNESNIDGIPTNLKAVFQKTR